MKWKIKVYKKKVMNKQEMLFTMTPKLKKKKIRGSKSNSSEMKRLSKTCVNNIWRRMTRWKPLNLCVNRKRWRLDDFLQLIRITKSKKNALFLIITT
jgi:hypothetical protein